ncbi:MAG: type II toxin-antitoxin system HicA family toxin [Saprospiraceae bacterium]|nr:type II toxin-antitoxin system HicA family toxin [Saprospiraceae bacterium]
MKKIGWYEVRQQGSHRIFKHPQNPLHISVPDHGKYDLAPGILNKLLKKSGIK